MTFPYVKCSKLLTEVSSLRYFLIRSSYNKTELVFNNSFNFIAVFTSGTHFVKQFLCFQLFQTLQLETENWFAIFQWCLLIYILLFICIVRKSFSDNVHFNKKQILSMFPILPGWDAEILDMWDMTDENFLLVFV